MEKKDLKEIEKTLTSLRTFTIAQTRLMKDILNEIKLLRRDIQSQHSTETIWEIFKRKIR